ncbi:5'/3'-nucleotidase SurE [Larsenimonas salina]|uniref:5'/3'-nucleotidase SurE n=1 Tax=Larsenimonas salina TaxID=1295565 RepID=UPI00207392AF|nr:5'/3'-nucleotidase SurE [Larsenimonas salina]MCM5704547.1 hypothetical protein [Larsenimonas salina]
MFTHAFGQTTAPFGSTALSPLTQTPFDGLSFQPVSLSWGNTTSTFSAPGVQYGHTQSFVQGSLTDLKAHLSAETPTAPQSDAADANAPLDILLTNDDGFDAPGIQSMYEALTEAGHNVTIVAPKDNQSAQGSSLGGVEALTSTIGVGTFDDAGNYWVDGRPKVAVETALDSLLADQHFDLAISGTNSGENIGTSENISGTVGAAVQALQNGLPAIAVSADTKQAGDSGFDNAAEYTLKLLDKLQNAQKEGEPLLPDGTGLSVNAPAGEVDGVALTEITRKSSTEYPIVENDDGSYGSSGIDQQGSGSATAEGDQFLENKVTVSAIDGNWSANEQARSALEARLGDLLGDGETASDHAGLNVMLVNDDGYQAEGLEAARDALLDAGYTVTVVAPTEQQSGVGSSLTLGSFEVTEFEAGYHVDATPSTTVYTGMDALLQGMDKPDLVVSGINQGANVGLQANASGTLSAAVASVFNYDVPAIAMSAGTDETGQVPGGLYATSADFLVELIGDLQSTTTGNGVEVLPEGLDLNVNVPVDADLDNIAFTLMDQANNGELGVTDTGSGDYAFTLGEAVNTDAPYSEGTHFNDGDITITPIDGSYQADDDVTALMADLLGIQYGAPSLVRHGDDDGDTLTGGLGNDWITGGAGDDIILASAGNDDIDGGEGNNTVVFDGARDDYRIDLDGDTVLVTDRLNNDTDMLNNIATLAFDDTALETAELHGTGASEAYDLDGLLSGVFDGAESLLTAMNQASNVPFQAPEDWVNLGQQSTQGGVTPTDTGLAFGLQSEASQLSYQNPAANPDALLAGINDLMSGQTDALFG